MSGELYFFIYYLARFALPLFVNECLFLPYVKKRKNFYLKFILSTLGFFLVTFLITYFDLDIKIGWFRFNFLMIFICSIIPFLVSAKLGIKEMLFFAMASYAMQNLADKVSAFTLVASGISTYDYPCLLIFLLINVIFSIVFFLVFVMRIENHSLDAMNNKYIYFMMVFTLLIVYVISMYAPFVEEVNRTSISLTIYSVISCLLLLIIQFNVFNFGYFEYEKKMLVNLIDKENTYYKQVKANIDSINIRTHDLKHQISALRKISTEASEIKALDELEKEVQIYDDVIKTNNPTIDLILQDKRFYCDKHQINFAPIVDGSLLEFIDPIDLYSLFGNLIDNSIQAVLKLPKDERVIQLNVKEKQGFIIIQVINKYSGNVKFINDIPITDKQGSLHGFGSKSILYIAKKYKGKVNYKTKDDEIFEVDIFFPTSK